jgi:hypothetical protein
MDSPFRRYSFALVLSLIAFGALGTQRAQAASLAVTINQVSPDGPAQQATCALNKPCAVAIAVKSPKLQSDTVTVNAHYAGKILFLTFQTPNGYLYAGETVPGQNNNEYVTIWHRALQAAAPSKDEITLYLPLVSQAVQAPILSVATEAARKSDHPTVATIQVTTQPAQ